MSALPATPTMIDLLHLQPERRLQRGVSDILAPQGLSRGAASWTSWRTNEQ
jgi:hypothetical protein